jgi:hypothetical protein
VGLTSGDIIWFSTFQLEVPDHLMSRLSSFDWFGSVALNPLGYALVGPLANVLGVPTTLYLSAALNAVVSLAVASSPAVRGWSDAPPPIHKSRVGSGTRVTRAQEVSSSPRDLRLRSPVIA